MPKQKLDTTTRNVIPKRIKPILRDPVEVEKEYRKLLATMATEGISAEETIVLDTLAWALGEKSQLPEFEKLEDE